MFWITFNLDNRDVVGAKIEGNKATRYWNNADPVEVTLKREYSYIELASLSPTEIQMGIIAAVGFEINRISNLRITQENIQWDTYWKENRK